MIKIHINLRINSRILIGGKQNYMWPTLFQFIDVSYCQWFDPQFLVPLAKCRNLKVLLMVGCRNMKDIIPYASIAAAYGYRQLEVSNYHSVK